MQMPAIFSADAAILRLPLLLVGLLVAVPLLSCQSNRNEQTESDQSATRTAPTGDRVEPGYVASVDAWYAQRIQRLKDPAGWLTLAGLFPLTEGTFRFGSAPDNDFVFPGSVPAYAGEFKLTGGQVVVEAEPNVEITHKSTPITSLELQDDSEGDPTLLTIRSVQFFVIDRGGRKYVRVLDRESDVLRNFTGIERFPVSPRWRIVAHWEPYLPPHKVMVPNALGFATEKTCPGVAVFEVDGKEFRLEPTGEPGQQLFFVFADGTSGKETYSGGRFLYADPPRPDGNVVLDFNLAYDPPCVFTPYATCPLPLAENKLAIRIEAGEKMYGQAHQDMVP